MAQGMEASRGGAGGGRTLRAARGVGGGAEQGQEWLPTVARSPKKGKIGAGLGGAAWQARVRPAEARGGARERQGGLAALQSAARGSRWAETGGGGGGPHKLR